MNNLEQKIKVMQHFANGGEVETKAFDSINWIEVEFPQWDWSNQDYRIKEQKKTVTIEKWLMGKYDNPNYLWAVEGTKEHFKDIEPDIYTKVKLLKTYEVEI